MIPSRIGDALIPLVASFEGIPTTRQSLRSTFQRQVNHELISTNINQSKKARINDLTRFDNLPTSSRQKGEDLIQPTELQGL